MSDPQPHLNEVGEFGVPSGYQTVDLVLLVSLLFVNEGDVILGQPRLACTVLQQDEPDHLR